MGQIARHTIAARDIVKHDAISNDAVESLTHWVDSLPHEAGVEVTVWEIVERDGINDDVTVRLSGGRVETFRGDLQVTVTRIATAHPTSDRVDLPYCTCS